METSSDSVAASDPFETFIHEIYLGRRVYFDLRGGDAISQYFEIGNSGIFRQCPKLLEHDSDHGVIPLDTSKHTVCLSYCEPRTTSFTVIHRCKRLEFDTAEQAEVFAGVCRLAQSGHNSRSAVVVISPSEAADLNASGCLTTTADAARIALGNQRLLKLAGILDVADAEHAKRGTPAYDPHRYRYKDCGTPGCPLGHWATAHPERWIFLGNAPFIRGYGPLSTVTGEFAWEPYDYGPLSSAIAEFALNLYDSRVAFALFSGNGCNNASTAKEAAAYLRGFVARRRVTDL